MANNLSSNITRKVARVFLDKFESERVLSKAVNTQLLEGKFNPSSGSTVDFKRPHDYRSIKTAGGDISAETKNSIIAGKATGTVQDYYTVPIEWTNYEEALELDQLAEIVAPAAQRIATDVDVDFGLYMIKNCNLSYGTPGTAVDAWSDVAGAGALMKSVGVPQDGPWYYAMNPFSTMSLADAQNGLSSGSSDLVDSAWKKSMISKNFGGLQALTCSSLSAYTSGTAADRAGTLSATPTATYVAHKDTMTQSLAVAGFTADATIKAGEIIEITGRYRLNMSTKQAVLNAAGAQILWRAVVTADVTLSGTGTGTIVVAGPAMIEANGQYNNVPVALTSGDVITILGSASTVYQPSMFFHKNAYGIGSVKLPKLYSTDTIATTADGMSFRVSKYSDGDANSQKMRIDFLPAFATFNPFFAGQGFGVA